MTTYNAAYCSACRKHVFVTVDGICEFGHPRSQLRGIYVAELDRKTGRPMPPSADQHSAFMRPVAPVAPIVAAEERVEWDAEQHAQTPHPSPQDDFTRRDMSSMPSVIAPLAPVVSAAGPSAVHDSLVIENSRRGLGRLFGLTRGRLRTPGNGGEVSAPLLTAVVAVAALVIAASVLF